VEWKEEAREQVEVSGINQTNKGVLNLKSHHFKKFKAIDMKINNEF